MLRRVFAEFDSDGSGAVSVDEMSSMVKELKLDLSAEQVRRLVDEADLDKSGQVEYAEFAAALRRQLEGGGGDFGKVVAEANSVFSWFSSFNPFGSKSPRSSTPRGEAQASPPLEGAPSAATESSRRGSGDGFLGTHRMKKTQLAVQAYNYDQALAKRENAEAAKQWVEEQKKRFRERAREKVLNGQQDRLDRRKAIAALAQVKRSMGSEMRKTLTRKLQEEKEQKRARVATSHSVVFEARRRKQSAVAERHRAEREQAVAIGEAAKVARAERKEKTKATVRREEQAAREYTARIKHETRPELRQMSRRVFQEQRDAIAYAEKLQSERDARAIEEERLRYLINGVETRRRVEVLRAKSHASRQKLAQHRKQMAGELRGELGDERERMLRDDEERRQAKQWVHDDVLAWSKESVAPGDAATANGESGLGSPPKPRTPSPKAKKRSPRKRRSPRKIGASGMSSPAPSSVVRI